jgi:hypothetical protein
MGSFGWSHGLIGYSKVSARKMEIEIVKRALNVTPEREERERRSQEIMELLKDYEITQKAYRIFARAEQEAEQWVNQPEEVKRKSPFYEEYMSHSDITKKAFVIGQFMTEEETRITNEWCSLYYKKYYEKYPRNRGIH